MYQMLRPCKTGILKMGSFLETSIADWERIIQTNVLGTFYTIHASLPHLLKQSQGDIITIASTAGLKGSANLSAYGASKAAVINMTESLMQEVRKKNIRVTTINPSTIATPMTLDAKFTDGNADKVLQPEDLAHIIVSNLKLPQRAFIKEFALWSTNPA
jgi:3-oxoacyl-[acyl-carrier protein] reductase